MKIDLGDLRPYTIRILFPNTDQTIGTGFYIHPDGYILTCHHVIKKSYLDRGISSISLSMGSASIVMEIPEIDLVVLKSDSNNLVQYLPLNLHINYQRRSNQVRAGVSSIGYPEEKGKNEGLYIRGKIAGKTFITVENYSVETFQISDLTVTNVAPGYSGAPIIDDWTQKVIGLLFADFIDNQTQAFILPIDPIIKDWKESKSWRWMYEFHDVYEQIRYLLIDYTRRNLEEKLRETELIDVKLQLSSLPDNLMDHKRKTSLSYNEWYYQSIWVDFPHKELVPPSRSYILISSVGMGKTTFLHALAEILNKVSENTRDVVALYIWCPEFVRLPIIGWENLQKALVEKYWRYNESIPENRWHITQGDIEAFLQEYYESNRIVFLFDGLDQIRHLNYDEVINKIFEVSWDNKFIISSRPSIAISYVIGKNLIFLRLLPFSLDDEKKYFGSYYSASRSLHNLAPNLTSVPMLAYMVRFLAESEGIEGINNRAELYKRFIRHILHSQNSKGIQSVYHNIRIRRDLQKLSYYSLEKEPPEILNIPAEFVYDVLQRNKQQNGNEEDLITCGLVNLILDKDEYFFSFTHQSYQEYLAAEFLLSDPTKKNERITQILAQRHKSKWREVIKFIAGLEGTAFIDQIGYENDNIIYSNLFLATECVCEVNKADPSVIMKIYQRLLEIPDNIFELITLKYFAIALLGIALRQYDEYNIEVRSFLERQLKTEDAYVFSAVKVAFNLLNEEGKRPVIEHTVKNLSSADYEIRDFYFTQFMILLYMGYEDGDKKRTVDFFKNEPFYQDCIFTAIGQLQKKFDDDDFKAVMSSLNNQEGAVRYVALKALLKHKDKVNQNDIMIVIERLKDQELFVREAAVKFLGAIRFKVEREHLNTIIGLMKERKEVRAAAIDVIGILNERIGNKDVTVVVKLVIEHLTDENESVRNAAYRSLLLFYKAGRLAPIMK